MDPVPQHRSKIGLGCVTFGREIDKKSAFTLLDHGFELGIRFFDTAQAYGDGASERILGEWLSANPGIVSSITVATKILPPFTPENITAAVDCSLKRLGGETIDLLYFHRWDATADAAVALRRMSDLVTEKKVRFLGASNFTEGQLRKTLQLQRASGLQGFSFVQNNNNYAVRDIHEGFYALCASEHIRIITYSPLGAGFLTGKHARGVEPGSRFALVPDHQKIYFQEKAIDRFRQLSQFADRSGYSTTTLALAWALHRPHVDTVLISGRIPAHIDQAFDALAFASPGLLQEIEVT